MSPHGNVKVFVRLVDVDVCVMVVVRVMDVDVCGKLSSRSRTHQLYIRTRMRAYELYIFEWFGSTVSCKAGTLGGSAGA